MTDEPGGAGASARAEYERRRANDEARIYASWGRFGKIAVALTPEKQSTRAWSTGAIGEEKVGAKLDAIAGESIRVLHDRRIPRSKANIDHIVVTGGGIWVIDTKRYEDKRPEKRVEGGWFSPRIEKLWVRGDKTKLVDSMKRQVELVQNVVGGVPVRGVLCFIDADWPLIGDPFSVNDVLVVWPRKLTKLIVKDAEGEHDVDQVTTSIAATFSAS